MVDEWRVLSLAEAPLEIIDGDRGVNYPKQEEFFIVGHCLFLNAGNVSANGFNFSNCAFITALKDAALRKGKLVRNDVVLTTRGTIGNSAFFDSSVPFDHIRINSGMVILRPQPEYLHPRYLYLFVRSPLFHSQVAALRTGSAQPQLPIRDINRIEIPVPPHEEQRAIAHVLGTLDDKIELNRRMNETLEAMARAIFKSWFVDFDPVRAKMEGRDLGLPKEIADLFPDRFQDSELGEIPKGWKVARLREIAEIVDCLHSKKPAKRDAGSLLLQVYNVGTNGQLDLSNPFYISQQDYEIWTRRIEITTGDLVITKTGRVGAVAQIPPGVRAGLGRNMVGIRARLTHAQPRFLRDYLLSNAMRREIELMTNVGTILSSLHVKTIELLRLVLPPKPVIEAYDELIKPLHCRKEANVAECLTLADLRDTLLPKLISGELRIKDTDGIISEVT
jgi:type I restriction enzyme S subunit